MNANKHGEKKRERESNPGDKPSPPPPQKKAAETQKKVCSSDPRAGDGGGRETTSNQIEQKREISKRTKLVKCNQITRFTG
jgi:hypothetical protein